MENMKLNIKYSLKVIDKCKEVSHSECTIEKVLNSA